MAKKSTTLSFGDIERLLREAVKKTTSLDSVYVQEVYPDSVVYSDWSTESLYMAKYEIGDNNQITLSDTQPVIRRTLYEPVVMTASFSLDSDASPENVTYSETDEDYVYRTGKIFEVGEWKDKNFAISKEELADVITNFTPVPVDLEHTSTVLDGKLGRLENIELSENGLDLMGTVALPRWLDKLMEDGKRKVSCTWERATKQLRGLALVNNPRVSDAALMSAFADSELSEYAGKRHNASDQAEVQRVHDASTKLGAECATDAKMSTTPIEEKTMPTPVTELETKIEGMDSADFAEKFQAMQARIDAAEKLNAKLLANQRHSASIAFATELIEVKKTAYPSEKEMLIALFDQAAMDDEEDAKPKGLASFGEAKVQASRVAAIKAIYAMRPTYDSLLEEGMGIKEEDGISVLYSKKSAPSPDDDTTISDARRRELLNHTSLGAQMARG